MKILTFDVEDWFHVLDHPQTSSEVQWENFSSRIDQNISRILEMLSTLDQSATFFCLGWIAEKYPHIVRKISEAGFEIGSHSHLHQLAYTQSPDQFRSDLRRSIAEISKITGRPVELYRIPGFSLTQRNLWVFEILAEEGINIDCSVFPASRLHGGLPEFPSDEPCLIKFGEHQLLEFPINVHRVLNLRLIYSGGGYFRLLPYALIHSLVSANEYIMSYFHPRDFDPDQPMIPGLSPARLFKSYVGLRGAQSKLEKLLREFHFVDVRQAANSLDLSKISTVQL